MKKSTILLLLSINLLTLSCKSNIINYRDKHPEYYDLSKPLTFIKNNVKNSTDRKFRITIKYGHNSIKQMVSDLTINDSVVEIKTETKFWLSEQEKKVDTIFQIKKNVFLKEIDSQIVHSKSIVVFAGNYQWIQISEKDKIVSFPISKVGMGLVRLLEKSELISL